MNKPLCVMNWIERPSSKRPLARRARVGLVAVAISVPFVVSSSGCSKAQTPTVLATGNSEASIDGLAISSPDLRGPQAPNATVMYVTDGDTIVVRFTHRPDNPDSPDNDPNGTSGPTSETIRLIGIDTPESKRPNTPVECFAREASNALELLVPKTTPVRIELDIEHRDRYGRLLGYVFRASDGLFINHEMVRSGMAAASTFPPNVTYADQFSSASSGARANNVGLWSRCESEHEPSAKPA